jgi:hypothetical protein
MVADPEAMLAQIFAFLGLEHEPQAVNYGEFEHVEKGLGDPIGVAKHSRPTTASVEKWAVEIATVPDRLQLCRDIVARLDPGDLALWGHPIETFWEPLERASGAGKKPVKKKLDRYRMQRKAIVKLRATVQRSPALRRLLGQLRLGADVLLRE